jgi:uncharacterized membrane protein YciS (DUF1049 family)
VRQKRNTENAHSHSNSRLGLLEGITLIFFIYLRKKIELVKAKKQQKRTAKEQQKRTAKEQQKRTEV